uniref:Secreted protein n=1 Tax=Steinernema glaseri TaxID=37863 RepID=A0A1I8A6N6_9BILA
MHVHVILIKPQGLPRPMAVFVNLILAQNAHSNDQIKSAGSCESSKTPIIARLILLTLILDMISSAYSIN